MTQSVNLKSGRHSKPARKIPALIFGPLQVARAFARAQAYYAWFRRGENRFRADGLHGHSGYVFFEAYDAGHKLLDTDRFAAAYLRDAAAHTRNRFAAGLRSTGKRTIVATSTAKAAQP